MRSQKGAVLFETLFWLEVLLCLSFVFHLQLIRHWRGRMEKLQERRLTYDGVKAWRP